MSLTLKIIAGLLVAIGALAIVSAIAGNTGVRFEAAIQSLVLALVLAAVARLLDGVAALGKQLEHIRIQVDETRWERKPTPS